MKPPVFVLGSPRSGTTLLYHMLLSSGGFAIYRAESNVFNLLVPRCGDLSVPDNKKELMNAWLRSKMFKVSGLEAQHIESKILTECRNGGDFLRIVMEEVARRQSVDRWADCTPDHLLYIPQIRRVLPESYVIHVIRDGRDCGLSLGKLGWVRPFPWHRASIRRVGGLFWEWMVRKGRKYGEMIAPHYIEVRFEELVLNPQQTLASLGEFIKHDLNYNRIQQVAIGSLQKPNTS